MEIDEARERPVAGSVMRIDDIRADLPREASYPWVVRIITDARRKRRAMQSNPLVEGIANRVQGNEMNLMVPARHLIHPSSRMDRRCGRQE